MRGFGDGDLVADGLSCRRGGRQVFGGLNCVLPAGGALLLTGANGSGKSSLLRLLATLFMPEAGTLAWGSTPVADDLPGYRARLHYVGHLDAIKPSLAVRETLAFWAALRGVRAPSVDAALAAFSLDAIADWPCQWLSAGQKRRLALARLLASPAPLWLLDEPIAALDADGERRLVAVIEAHRAGGGRVAISTHQRLPIAGATVLALEDFAPPADDPSVFTP